MKKSRFTEEQIVAILKESEAGVANAEVCRKHGISDATFYGWRAKYGGMTVGDVRRLKALEEENARLKRIVGQQARKSTGSKTRSQKSTNHLTAPRRCGGVRRGGSK